MSVEAVGFSTELVRISAYYNRLFRISAYLDPGSRISSTLLH